VPQEVKDLYSLLETEFHPLDLANRVKPLLEKLPDVGDSLSPASPVPEVRPEEYVAALEKVTTAKLLSQVGGSTRLQNVWLCWLEVAFGPTHRLLAGRYNG
jgi:hypothetical protein